MPLSSRYWRGRVRKQACRSSRLPHSKKETDDHVILSCGVFRFDVCRNTLLARLHNIKTCALCDAQVDVHINDALLKPRTCCIVDVHIHDAACTRLE
mmetsp:Transcript_2785/g.3952  ORF Transcript_2785/g.3952 Transcript_2785/m.3952 type:complete len:97 (+) Transcript_2785:169-459(+)